MISNHSDNDRQPNLYGIILLLLSILVAYPLVGSLLTMLVTGGRSLDSGLDWLKPALLPRFLAVQAFGQILVLALPVIWVVRSFTQGQWFGKESRLWLGIRKPDTLLPVMAAGAGMLLLQPFLYTLVEVQIRLLPYLGRTGQALLVEQDRLDQLFRMFAGGQTVQAYLLSFLVLVVTPSVCEELFFRGFLQKSLSLVISRRIGVLAAGFLFALFHMEWFNLLPLTLLGWYIGYTYMKSENLLVPAVAHAVNNLAALVLLKTDAQLGRVDHAASAVLSLWQWWFLVFGALFIFLLLLRFFPSREVFPDTDNPMSSLRT
jgi:membrane protease YdiL (CAAX protease family)